MNVNLNSVQSKVQQNPLSSNKLSKDVKNSFMNLLTSMTGDNTAVQDPLNILESLIGNNIYSNGLNNSLVADAGFNNINAEKEEKLNEDNTLKELVEMQSYFSNPNIANIQLPLDSIKDIKNINGLINSVNSEKLQELSSSMNLKNIQSNKFVSDESKIKPSNTNEVFNKIPEAINFEELKGLESTKIESSSLRISAEKLIKEIDNNRDKLKNSINMQAEAFTATRSVSKDNNTIINISDESSQIKSQVLSQIKDKIVFMTEESSGTGSSVKHVTMELNPVHLGKVDIKMTFENNKVTVEINAQNEETQKLISSNKDVLASILGKTSESVNILIKSNDSRYEQHVVNYNANPNSENLNHDTQNNHGRQRNNYYYEEDNKNNDNDSDNMFSQLMNLRAIKLNA